MDATVEDYEHPEVLVQETPYFISTVYSTTVSLIQNNGWLFLGIGLAGYFIWNKFQDAIKQNVDNILIGQNKKVDGPANDEKLRLAREKMQKELSIKAELHKEKLKQKEEEERKRKLEEIDNKHDKGNVLDADAKKKSTPLFKSEYNPLMGGSSGRTYRPPRRSACGGGGCGRR